MRRHDNGWGDQVDLGPDPAAGKRRQVSKQGFRTKRERDALAISEHRSGTTAPAAVGGGSVRRVTTALYADLHAEHECSD